MADVEPVEYSDEAYGTLDEKTPGPFHHGGMRAMEMLMRPPRGTEQLTWYAWHVEDGCRRLASYPNWSGRAIRTAGAMAELAKNSPHEAELTSSAIIQSYVALGAFLTSWRMLALAEISKAVLRNDVLASRHDGRSPEGENFKLVDTWDAMARRMFGTDWKMPDPEGFRILAELRNRITHQISLPETVIPTPRRPKLIIDHLVDSGVEIRPAPGPWADRIMTAGVAAWAVSVAEAQLAAVKDAWDEADRRSQAAEWLQELEARSDEDGTASDPIGWAEADESPFPSRVSILGVEGTGLRRFAAREPRMPDNMTFPDVA